MVKKEAIVYEHFDKLTHSEIGELLKPIIFRNFKNHPEMSSLEIRFHAYVITDIGINCRYTVVGNNYAHPVDWEDILLEDILELPEIVSMIRKRKLQWLNKNL